MILNAVNVREISRNIRADFNKGVELAKVIWPLFAMKIQSTGSENLYPFLEGWPKFKEWIGERAIENIAAQKYTLVNKKYEATLSIPRDAIEDDNLGIYGPMAQEMGKSAMQLFDELMAALIATAFTTGLCYDGQAFFDGDHPRKDSTTQSNTGTVALSAATQAAAIASLGAAITAMQILTDYSGRKLAVMPDTLMVPPALRDTANVLYNNERLEDGKPNPYKGQFKPQVNPYLSSSTAWFLLQTTGVMKPFIVQERTAPEITAKSDARDENVFSHDEFVWGGRSRGAVGFGLWHYAWGSTGTV